MMITIIAFNNFNYLFLLPIPKLFSESSSISVICITIFSFLSSFATVLGKRKGLFLIFLHLFTFQTPILFLKNLYISINFFPFTLPHNY